MEAARSEKVLKVRSLSGGKRERKLLGGKLEMFKVDSSEHRKGGKRTTETEEAAFFLMMMKKMQLVIVWNQVVAHHAEWRERLFCLS